MKKELKDLGQILYRKELKNEELKNSIGGKGYTCGGFNCYQTCTTLSGNRRCARYSVDRYVDAGWGCSGGSAVAQCWCYGSFGSGTTHLCE